jgi:hypothetical protein
MARVALTLAFLPLMPWMAVAVGAWLMGAGPQNMTLIDGIMVSVWYSLFSYFAMGFVAVPLLLLCAWRRWTTIWHAMTVGATTGFLPLGLPMITQLFNERLHLHYRLEQLASTWQFTLLGAFTGALFWVLAIWRNRAFPPMCNPHIIAGEA